MTDLFSKELLGTLKGQRHTPLGAPVPKPNVWETETIKFLDRSEGMFRRVIAQRALEERNFKDRSFISATGIAQQSFDFELKKELARFYTSDGQDLTPPATYSKDLGFGVSLSGKDFLDTDGKRRSYVEAVKYFHSRFSDMRKGKAPSVRAENAASLKMREGELRAVLGAQKFQDRRQGAVLANNLNAVVRSYKEVLAKERGFNPDTFALHVESMLDTSGSSLSLLDAGAVARAVRLSLGDMLAVGITEAHTNRDNTLALRFLADTPLRDTEMVRKAVAGLSATDKAYLEKYRKAARLKGRKRFALNDKPPKNRGEFFEWAIAQQDEKRKGELQARAIKAFASQTEQVRNILASQIQGLQVAAFSPQVKDAGFRQAIRQSAAQALADIQRVYPKDLYMQKNLETTAAVLVGAQAVEIRNMFDDVPTENLGQYAATMSNIVSNSIMAQLPKDKFTMALPIQQKVHKALATFSANEAKARQADPYGSLKRISKEIRNVDDRLSVGDYVSAADKYKDQAILRDRVVKKSNQLGLTPSFLSGNEALTISSLAKMQNKAELGKVIGQVRDKFGEGTFYDYIVPQLGTDEMVGTMALGYSIVPSKEVSNMLLEATINTKKNRQFLKDAAKGDQVQEVFQEIDEQFSWWEWYDRWNYGATQMAHIDGYILDRFGSGATGRRAMTSMRRAVGNLAMQYLVTGMEEDGDSAARKAVDTVINGIGQRGEFKGNDTIFPSQMTLNEPRRELLESVLFNQNFLMEQVYPHIVPNNPVIEKAKIEKVDPSVLLHKYFTDDDIMRWGFSWEGVVPFVENPLFPDLRAAIPRKTDGNAFLIPYTDLPSLIVNPRYN